MINVEEIRRDFPMLKQTMQGKQLVYLDNAATTFKPQAVIDAVCNYYTNFNANCHRGDYDLSHDVDVAYEGVRTKVGKFIVSTVDLGFDEMAIKMFGYTYETMICKEKSGDFLDYQERYKTEEEARKGHQEAIEYVKDRTK